MKAWATWLPFLGCLCVASELAQPGWHEAGILGAVLVAHFCGFVEGRTK